jgi:hypothetical protein
LNETLDAKAVTKLLERAGTDDPVTIWFIYTEEEKFITKVESRPKGKYDAIDRKLWPDEDNPEYQQYKRLARAAGGGDGAGVKTELEKGAKHFWPNRPNFLSPLERSARTNRVDALQELLRTLPMEFPTANFANGIKLAAQERKLAALDSLLGHAKASEVRTNDLQEIFKAGLNGGPSVLEKLLEKYPVGLEIRLTDVGHTMLFTAVQSGNYPMAEWLVKKGANRKAKLDRGNTMMQYARDPRFRQLLEVK